MSISFTPTQLNNILCAYHEKGPQATLVVRAHVRFNSEFRYYLRWKASLTSSGSNLAEVRKYHRLLLDALHAYVEFRKDDLSAGGYTPVL